MYDVAEEGFFSNRKRGRERAYYQSQREKADQYPALRDKIEDICYYIERQLIKEMQRLKEKDFAVTIEPLLFANDHFFQACYIEGDASKVNFKRVIGLVQSKFHKDLAKYNLTIEQEEYKYCDGLIVYAYNYEKFKMSCEAFMDFCDDMMIATEGTGKWGNKERAQYKKLQFALNNPIGRSNQIRAVKNECKKRLNHADGNQYQLEVFDEWLDKQIRLVTRIKAENKQKFAKAALSIYQDYKRQVAAKLNE